MFKELYELYNKFLAIKIVLQNFLGNRCKFMIIWLNCLCVEKFEKKFVAKGFI